MWKIQSYWPVLLAGMLFPLFTSARASADLIFTLQDGPTGLRLGMQGSLDTSSLSIPGSGDSGQLSSFINRDIVGVAAIQAGGSATVIDLDVTTVTPLRSLLISDTPAGDFANAGDLVSYLVSSNFGFFFVELPSDFQTGDMLAPRPDVVFASASIESVFGTSLDAGPVTLGQFENGQALRIQSISPVPEPSTTMILMMSSAAVLGLRSKNRNLRRKLKRSKFVSTGS